MKGNRRKAATTSASYAGFKPASEGASKAARAASKKRDTKPELLLRSALWRLGYRYRIDVASLPGRPDIVLAKYKLAVFCDGDFWHGRNLDERVAKLKKGHNPTYWVAKITRNVARDRAHDAALIAAGWRVLRLWEGDIAQDAPAAAQRVAYVAGRGG